MILTQPCPVCHGRGTTCEGRACPADDRLRENCLHCVSGQVPTEEGRRVLGFVKTFGGLATVDDLEDHERSRYHESVWHE